MIGLFLVDDKQDLAFFQYGAHQDIAGIKYFAHNQMCALELASGEEEFLDSQMIEQIIATLQSSRHALIAHIGTDAECITQYSVPIQVFH